jgi:predicted nuclease of predicted toxin-antitoxin system
VTFLVDAQLPYSLAMALTTAGYPAKAVRDIGLRDADDDVIWDHAASNGCCILTKDQDFADRVGRTRAGPSVVWLRIGNCSNQDLRDQLIPLLEEIARRLDSGDRLIEIC